MAQDGSAQAQATPKWRSPGFKFLLIVILTVAMAVPLFFIQLALSDREQTASGAATDIADGLGRSTGRRRADPVRALYRDRPERRRRAYDPPSLQQYTAVLLPENAGHRHAGGHQHALARHLRGAGLSRGDHDARDVRQAAMASLAPRGANVQWDRASVAIRVSDAHGLADNVTLHVNGGSIAFSPGVDTGGDARLSGIQAPLDLSGPADLTLDTSFTLARFARVQHLAARPAHHGDASTRPGRRRASSAPSCRPSARSARTVSRRPGSCRIWRAASARASRTSANVDGPAACSRPSVRDSTSRWITTSSSQRSLKYAILFVALAFLVFFVVETVSPQRLHAVQYALVGRRAGAVLPAAAVVLASISASRPAYLVAAAATVVLTSLYAVERAGQPGARRRAVRGPGARFTGCSTSS